MPPFLKQCLLGENFKDIDLLRKRPKWDVFRVKGGLRFSSAPLLICSLKDRKYN